MKIFLKPYKPAKIYLGKNDCYVYYHYKDPDTGNWEMFKDRAGLNYKDVRSNAKLQKQLAKEICEAYNEKLKAGWSPFGYQSKQNEEYDQLRFMPVRKVFDKFLDTKKTTTRRRTWQSYKYAVDILDKWLKENSMHHTTLEFFTANNAMAFADSLMASGNYANKTFNGHVNVLKLMFNLAIDRELITKNPFAKIKPLPVEVGKNFAYSEAQKAKLKEKILEHDPELWRFVKCIYHLFIRPLELLRLKVSDVDLRTLQVIVPASASKNKKQMAVEIPESFAEEVKAWGIEKLPADWYLFGKDLKPGPNPYHRNSVTKRHAEIAKMCGIDSRYSMYSWKHTGNVDSFLAGIDVYDIMRQNRHHSLEQTMNYLRSLGLRPNVNYSKKAPQL